MVRRRFSEAELDALFGMDPPASATPTALAEQPAPEEPPPPPPATSTPEAQTRPAARRVSSENTVLEIPLREITANPHQPRTQFDETKLREMADSIRVRGVLQPILVRKAETGYQLVAGERRLRAAALADRPTIPALVVSLGDRELVEVALIENLQRDDLNAIEEARAYDYLCKQFGLTYDDVARRVGKDRTTVVNMIRLLQLPLGIKLDLQNGVVSAGHARALLALDNEEQMLALHKEIVARDLSVRQTEEKVRGLQGQSGPARRKPRKSRMIAPEIEELQNRMTEAIGVRVRVLPRTAVSGRIEVIYSSLDELDRVCARLGLRPDME